MRCPVDQADLVMSERSGVEIDYCPTCRGVWLDRGELDKILDRATPAPARALGEPPAYGTDDSPRYDPRRDDRGRYGDAPAYGDDGRRRRKKESWLGDLFDF